MRRFQFGICILIFTFLNISVSLAVELIRLPGGASKKEAVILSDLEGHLFRLVEQDGSLQWVRAEKDILKQSGFHRAANEYITLAGLTKITGNGLVEVNGQQDLRYSDAPDDYCIVDAQSDINGDFYLLGNGQDQALFYQIVNDQGVGEERQYRLIETGHLFSKILGNPFGKGVLALTRDGALLQISFLKRRVVIRSLAPSGTVENLEFSPFGVVVLTQSGSTGLLRQLGPLQENLVSIPMPRDFKNKPKPLVLTSSYGPNPIATLYSAIMNQLMKHPVAGGAMRGHGDEEVRLLSYGIELPRPVPLFDALISQNGSMQAFENETQRVINDDIALDAFHGKLFPVLGREREAGMVIETLIRTKGKNPILVGEAGVGKTTVAELVARKIATGAIPVARQFQESLSDAIVVQTSASSISNIHQFLNGLKQSEIQLRRKIILYVDEIHQFSAEQLEALKTYLDSTDGISFIGSTTHHDFGLMVKRNAALKRRFQPIDVPELSVEDTRHLLRESYVPLFSDRYRGARGKGVIQDQSIDAAIRLSRQYLPDSPRPEGPLKLLQDAMISVHRESQLAVPVLTAEKVGRFLAQRLRLKLNPYDSRHFFQDIENIKAELRAVVVDQHRYTDALVDLWRDIHLAPNPDRTHRVLLVAGPTGAGKTHGALAFAKLVLGSEERLLEVDAGKIQASSDLSTLFGAAPGLVDSNENRGVIPEFLSGRGRGVNVIIFNEMDKAHSSLWTAVLELADTGKTMGSDGNTYYLGHSILILTTNKGAHRIYPRGYGSTNGYRGQALTRQELERRWSQFTDEDIKSFFLEPNPQNLYEERRVPPEALQRIDRAVPAGPPSFEGAVSIAKIEAQKLMDGYEKTFGYHIAVDDAVILRMVEGYYNPENGVRTLRREVSRLITEALTESAQQAAIKAGDSLRVVMEGERFRVLRNTSTTAAVLPAPPSAGLQENPLLDATHRDAVSSLTQRLERHVFGQDQAIRLSARALRVRSINASLTQPAALLYLGPTGTGKTELALAIAQEHYHDIKRVKTFKMGAITTREQLTEIFGSSPSYVGSERVSPLEQFLLDFPEGGVLLFDEIGNVGGTGKTAAQIELKRQVLGLFYTMLDHGIWTNQHGKDYDIRKFTLVFTSNEGQELFDNDSTDDLRLATWDREKNKENLVKLLKDHGWPEALIGRLQGNIILFKPLALADRMRIARKLIEKAVVQVKAQHHINHLEIGDEFCAMIAESFFSHSSGARGIRDLADGVITDLLGDAILYGYEKDPVGFFKSAHLRFDVIDNFAGRFTYADNTSPQRQVLVNLWVEHESQSQLFTADASDNANEHRLVSLKQAMQTAVHEAGHAVGNSFIHTGDQVDFITIRGKGGFAGYTRFKSLEHKGSHTRADAIAFIARALGGREAEKIFGYEADNGWATDLRQARTIAEEFVTNYGLTDQPLILPTNGGVVDVDAEVVQREIATLLTAGEALARERITRYRLTIEELSQKLMEHGHLQAAQIQEVLLPVMEEEYGSTCARALGEGR